MHEIYIFTLEKICSVRQRPIPKAPSCIATFVCLGLSTFVHTANYSFIFPTHHIPYKGGLFYLKIIFPDDYPTGKPKILFLYSIYHLKVKFFRGKDKLLGHICENTLNDWNSGDSVKKKLPELFSLLHKNNSDSPYDYNDNSRRNEFVNNRALFDKKAQYLAKKYSPSFTTLKEFPNVYLFSSISCPSGALIYISGFSFAFGESTTE